MDSKNSKSDCGSEFSVTICISSLIKKDYFNWSVYFPPINKFEQMDQFNSPFIVNTSFNQICGLFIIFTFRNM
jgi:abortive infection bacteriophage resistance protein